MTLVDWLATLYFWGLVPAWVILSIPCTKWLASEEDRSNHPETFHYIAGMVLGACCAWFWPLLIPGYWLFEFLKWHFKDES